LRPRSKGSIALTSPDFRRPPLVDPAIWADPDDPVKALELFRLMRRWAASPALAKYVGAERMPGVHVQDEAAVLDELRRMIEPGLHGTGTCRMGTDPANSVLDARCRVHGIDALRIVDCSTMPTTVSGNTSGPAMAVAARAAELILEDAR
jgi:choline dehydrogenase